MPGRDCCGRPIRCQSYLPDRTCPYRARSAAACDAGGLYPTEAQLAYEAGADFVKLFPADAVGPGYIKALRAPLPHLRIVPTGGVDVNNIAQFFKVGCVQWELVHP